MSQKCNDDELSLAVNDGAKHYCCAIVCAGCSFFLSVSLFLSLVPSTQPNTWFHSRALPPNVQVPPMMLADVQTRKLNGVVRCHCRDVVRCHCRDTKTGRSPRYVGGHLTRAELFASSAFGRLGRRAGVSFRGAFLQFPRCHALNGSKSNAAGRFFFSGARGKLAFLE